MSKYTSVLPSKHKRVASSLRKILRPAELCAVLRIGLSSSIRHIIEWLDDYGWSFSVEKLESRTLWVARASYDVDESPRFCVDGSDISPDWAVLDCILSILKHVEQCQYSNDEEEYSMYTEWRIWVEETLAPLCKKQKGNKK